MKKKSQTEPCCGAASRTCHGTYLEFLNGLLGYLRDAHADREQQRRDLAKIEALAAKLKEELPVSREKKGKQIHTQLDEVIQLARDYYPSEGDSPELGEAIKKLSEMMEEHHGLT